MSWRLSFDAARCDGFGMCSIVFPERISLDQWGFAHIDPEPIRDRVAQARAIRAARCCPRAALTLIPVDGESQPDWARDMGPHS